MSTLLETWEQVKYYLQNGVSVIPVRDKADEQREAKTPCGTSWKKYQKEIVSEGQLFHDMETYNTTAIGLIGGAVSGNLEIIDIDVKYQPGIDAQLFSAISQLYPELWATLRIHKSPSGGYHILYRSTEPVEGNNKLAGRPATETELALRPKNKTYNFIETRGEGGYVVAPPALGYSIHADRPIPNITATDRAAILALARSFTQLITPAKAPYKPTARDNDYYDENPFDHFNNDCDPDALMSELGWTLHDCNSLFRWYTRPGKAKGVSMSFNLSRRFFYCFTGSTELDEGKGYTPAVLASTLLHAGDRKKTYAYLVQKGYGKIKPQKEAQIAKRTATAGKPLPPNASPHAAALHVAISQQLATDHPYGIFWFEDTERQTIQIDRERLYNVSESLGWRLHHEKPVQILSTLIYKRTTREYIDCLKSYIHEEDGDEYIRIANAYESFIERHGKFTISRLQDLETVQIVTDTRTECFKFYENGMLKITSKGYSLEPYPENMFIWQADIKSRNFIDHNGGLYVDYIDKAIGLSPYLLETVGYLIHDFKDETAGYIVVLSEQCPNPKDGGGSGKNIFSALLGRSTSLMNKPGSQVKYDEKFMQSWNGQKIYCISDVPKNFDFSFIKELTTGSSTIKKLFIDEYQVGPEDMCKFLVSTNFSYEIKDGGVARRIRAIEFTDFFTKSGGVDVHYGAKHFPNDWTVNDWGGFDTFMALSAVAWLKTGRKISRQVLTAGGWQKQFEQTYGITASQFISDNFEAWCLKGWISNDDFKKQLESHYSENNIPRNYQINTSKLYEAFKSHGEKNGYIFNINVTGRDLFEVAKGKSFKKID